MPEQNLLTEGVIIAVISAFSGVAGALIGAWFARRKTEADAQKVEADTNEVIRKTVLGLLEPMQNKIKFLENEVNTLRGEVEKQGKRNKSLWRYIEKLLDVIRKLTQQLKDAGCIPCAEPPDWVDDGEG